jgi:hypothetical protein
MVAVRLEDYSLIYFGWYKVVMNNPLSTAVIVAVLLLIIGMGTLLNPHLAQGHRHL